MVAVEPAGLPDVVVHGELSLRYAQQLLEHQESVLGMIAEGRGLEETLTVIVSALEDLMPGARCSILRFNPATATLHHGAAPSLPHGYIAAINGMSIGESAGSCGTAAYLGTPVIATDIVSDPRWERFRDLAVPHGLRSCWSTPIRGRDGVSGTFAVYHLLPYTPTFEHQLLVDRFTHLASVAIDHDRLFGALTESEEHFRHAFEDNSLGMALVGLDSRVQRVNRALRDMLRRSDTELIGADIEGVLTQLAHPSEGAGMLDELIAGRQARVHFPAMARTSGGREIRLLVDAAVIRDAEGRVASVGMNMLDVTHRQAAEAERRARREAEVARRVAESASRNKSDFVAAMSHDLRTPLQGIAGFTEMLRTMDLSPKRRQTALAHIASATAHITAMVDDVLDIARIEAGSLPLRITHVPLDTVVREVLDIVAPLAEARQVTLATNRTTAVVSADERRLRQVLINLVTNAIVYNHPHGTVVIDVQAGVEDVTVSIANTGQGIPPDRLDRLFVPFDRLGAEETGEPGVGLGLSLALGLTEAMGGSLSVDSTPGEGTTVLVTLRRTAA